MACLYCGKEIGPFRQLRDSEFCGDAHRKKYAEQLGKALDQISTPEPPPAGIAAYHIAYPVQSGNTAFLTAPLLPHPHAARMDQFWRVPLADSDDAVEAAPPPVETRLASPAPQAAQRSMAASSGFAIPAVIPLRRPEIASLPIAGVFVARVETFASTPDAEPVERPVRAAIASEPPTFGRSPVLLRFTLHAVEDRATPSARPMPVPQAAGLAPGLAAAPVEAIPAAATRVDFTPACVPPLALPGIVALTPELFPQAKAVAGPAAIPVEAMPVSARPASAAIERRPELRLPALDRFEPAEEAVQELAPPAPGPAPSPVESMPVVAFDAIPAAIPPRIAIVGFDPGLPARFVSPAPPASPEAPAAVSLPQRRPAALDPIVPIAAQAAGAQPERPAPAIPRPGPFQLEYHCQRIHSAPVKSIEPIRARFDVAAPPFAVPAALDPLEDLLEERPPRKLFSLDELRAALPKRSNVRLGPVGKIAATVMVGIAVWAGSRLANLSRHTEAFKAQVAASERAVAVAESTSPDPTVGNFGKGPLGRVRRAIADRAATEITDTFRSGMTAWGAAAESWAPGWKRRSGYVSTGQMALFQPSLRYSDYRMEFYGQIEEKSIGWVVRAQDKKNYYAMKFTVVEPGLRPIIAMEHYGVVNGKPGHKVRTPLSVMVHNNRPIQVAVDVRGNHFTASVDGEPVDAWTDETLALGGVGFFSDPGERARLYWMKLSRNQDWLGRFCAYLSGDSRTREQTAELWGPAFPHPVPTPATPRPVAFALAPASGAAGGPGSISKQRRSERWN